MSGPVKVVVYAVFLVVVFASAMGVGRLVGPLDAPPAGGHTEQNHGEPAQ